MSWIEQLARPDIVALAPYEHAAWEPELTRLHANELPWRAAEDVTLQGLNHYPEPQPRAVRERLATLYNVPANNLLVTRGSDEAIDLLVRAFCRAEHDAVLICPPTFGMYSLTARIQGAAVASVPLRSRDGFALDAGAVLGRCTSEVKIVFLCSPNNPTGNLLEAGALYQVIEGLAGRALVVVDEAYVEFSSRQSLAGTMPRRPHLVVLRTLSKAHGLAGARLGTLLADPEVIGLLRKLIAPYAIPQPTADTVLASLSSHHLQQLQRYLPALRLERERLRCALTRCRGVTIVHPSDTNFLLVRFDDAARHLELARHAGLLVRDARGYPGLEDALRITVGTTVQNDRLIRAWS